ncbi:MAG: DUF1592 domain-containing protein, partial [Gemmataceae bacterium]
TIEAMQWSAPWGEKRGLKGEYFAARNYRKEKRVLERTDATIDFDFGITAPAEKLDPVEFSIYWFGSVLAPETGEYEFIVESDQAVVLELNHEKIIDRWVKSGDDSEFRASVNLVGDRAYNLKLEFSKAKQGVQNDPNKNKPKALKPARIRLLWKRPGQPVEVIPSRFLSPQNLPVAFASAVPFPPDDRSYGWERGTTISKEWDAATTEGAMEAAGFVLKNIKELTASNQKATDRVGKIRKLAERLAEHAFRRPLTPAEKRLYVDRHFEATPKDPDSAIKRVVLMLFKSPQFLYRETKLTPEPFAVASRVSYSLWDTLPDDQLRQASSENKWMDAGALNWHVERLGADPRASRKLHRFLHHWLGLDMAHEISKNSSKFPGFDAVAIHDLRTSLDMTLAEILQSPEADFRKLFTEDRIYLNNRLAKLYGHSGVTGTAFEKVALNPGQRQGVFSHPYMLTNYAYATESSPIHRGVFLARGILGQTLKPPMEAFTPLDAKLHPKLTTRERTEMQTGQRSCQACHGLINSLGFSLEKYDAIGRFRTEENGKPINDTGSYITKSGTTASFAGSAELSKFLMNSE